MRNIKNYFDLSCLLPRWCKHLENSAYYLLHSAIYVIHTVAKCTIQNYAHSCRILQDVNCVMINYDEIPRYFLYFGHLSVLLREFLFWGKKFYPSLFCFSDFVASLTVDGEPSNSKYSRLWIQCPRRVCMRLIFVIFNCVLPEVLS